MAINEVYGNMGNVFTQHIMWHMLLQFQFWLKLSYNYIPVILSISKCCQTIKNTAANMIKTLLLMILKPIYRNTEFEYREFLWLSKCFLNAVYFIELTQTHESNVIIFIYNFWVVTWSHNSYSYFPNNSVSILHITHKACWQSHSHVTSSPFSKIMIKSWHEKVSAL